MEHDTLTAGVSPGGLIDYHQILLLVCYMLKGAGPMPQESLLGIAYQYGLANFFELGSAISDLQTRGHITVSEDSAGETLLSATDSGKEVANTLEGDLPLSVREKAVKAAIALLARRELEKQNQVDIAQTDHGFTVTCHVSDGRQDLMQVTLLVGDRLQAESIREQFLSDPARVYKGILALQTGDLESFSDCIEQKNQLALF